MSPKVIAISGNMGAGKTTLTHALAKALHATTVCWDDFDEISSAPDDLVDWYHRGENYNEFNYQPLAHTLETLKSNHPIHHPALGTLLQPTNYIIFDAPLNYLHPQTAKFIDFSVHIEIPLDVSLIRWVIRDFKSSDKTKNDLIEELEFYLHHSRPLFIDDDIKSAANLIIDGTLPTDLQVHIIQQYLNSNTIPIHDNTQLTQ